MAVVRRKGSGMIHGMILIEVLVACFILTTGVLMLYGMYPVSMWALSDSQNEFMATQVARDRLQCWKNQGFAPTDSCRLGSCAPCGGSSGTVTLSNTVNRSIFGASSGITSNTVFIWSISVNAVIAGGVDEVYCSVSWLQGGAGLPHLQYVKMSTWVSQ